MSKLLITVAWLLLSSPAWADGCKTPRNFAALIELIANEGEVSDYGLTVAIDEKPYKYYASLVRGDLPELYLTRERWTSRRRKNRVDQWTMKFTVDEMSVLHKALVEKDHRLLGEKRLSNKGADAVGCTIFRTFLGSLPNPR